MSLFVSVSMLDFVFAFSFVLVRRVGARVLVSLLVLVLP